MEDLSKMDVDPPTSPKRRAQDSPSTSSSPEKHLKMTDTEQARFVQNMKHYSHVAAWQHRLKIAEDDKSTWEGLLLDVLTSLTRELGSTNIKGIVFKYPQNRDETDSLLQHFTKSEVVQWKDGIKSGVENDDWCSLVTHCKYISDYQISYLIITTVKLQITETPGLVHEPSNPTSQERGSAILKYSFLLSADCAPQPPRSLGKMSTLAKQQRLYCSISKNTTAPPVRFMPGFAPWFSHRGWGSQKPLMSLPKYISQYFST
jgi:hypothetical protein